FNACAVCRDGAIETYARKRHLPNYGVFDEKRYFTQGDSATVIEVAGTRVGITICEDMWIPGPPTTELAAAGAELVVNLSASPFHVGREREREEIFAARARENGVRGALCNTVGGQDELVFDGHSLVSERDGAGAGSARGVSGRGPAAVSASSGSSRLSRRRPASSPSRSRAASRISRKRTSRRECAGRSSWRSRTSSAGSSSRRGTSRSSRSATRPST